MSLPLAAYQNAMLQLDLVELKYWCVAASALACAGFNWTLWN